MCMSCAGWGPGVLLESLWSILLKILSLFSETGFLRLVQGNGIGKMHPWAIISFLLLISANQAKCANVVWQGRSSNRTKSLAALLGIVDDQDQPGSSRELFQGSLTLHSIDVGPLCLTPRNTALTLQHQMSRLCTPNCSNSRNGQDLPSTHLGNEQLQGRVLSSSLMVSLFCPSTLCPSLLLSEYTWGYKMSAFFFWRGPSAL